MIAFLIIKTIILLGLAGYQRLVIYHFGATILSSAPSLYANLRVPTRVYDVEDGAIFSKNSTFVFFDGAVWTQRLRSPSPIMAPGSMCRNFTLSSISSLFTGNQNTNECDKCTTTDINYCLSNLSCRYFKMSVLWIFVFWVICDVSLTSASGKREMYLSTHRFRKGKLI